MFAAAFLIVLTLIQIGVSVNNIENNINLTYILKREKERLQPSCIAEEFERYAGVGWVYPIPSTSDGIPAITTKFIPKIENKIFNCKFANNEFCNIHWEVRDWNLDMTSPKTRQFIGDRRWEDLPTIFISNSSKPFDHRYHIDGALKSGFSVRATGAVEIFLCSGWNPENYPCYHFRIDKKQVKLRHFASLPKIISENGSGLQTYQATQNVLSDDEWRSFEVSLDDGILRLIDKNLNRTAIEYKDSQPLEFTYFLMRSEEPSLWKISQNNFMYTKTEQISRMGPVLSTHSKDLCVSLFVSTCSNCKMSFFYLKEGTTKKILKQVDPTNEEWIEIKLKDENIKNEEINLFVETHFVDESLKQKEGFWAFDDVRICNENEVKVSFLKINETFEEDDLTVDIISCQLINKPSWRPYKSVYDEIKDFPVLKASSDESSITLSWEQEDPDNYISYFISYQSNELCQNPETSSKRSRSNGFVTTKNNRVSLRNLIPYTTYNITISSVFHENDKQLLYSTMESEKPSLDEIPYQLSIIPTDTSVNVTWKKPDCHVTQGRLIYNVIVSNSTFKKALELQTESTFVVEGLEPYTSYVLTVVTARNARQLVSGGGHSFDRTFRTMAGVAGTVKDLELYAIDTQTAYLRYVLPENPHGVPTEIQIQKCNALSHAKCRATVSSIEKCRVWEGKYCAEVNVIEDQAYNFKVAVKNKFTNGFGPYGRQISGVAMDRVPAPPENITYEIVDCVGVNDLCHLNVSWLHPKNPNATITNFNILMNTTNFNTTNSEEDEAIHDVYKIVNGKYLPKYTKQIKSVPFTDSYNLYIQSSNAKYHSEYVGITVKATDNLGDHIDQSPHLLGKSDRALVFQLPEVDKRLKSYTLIVAVQDYNDTIKIDPNRIRNEKLRDNLCHDYGNVWVFETVEVEPASPIKSNVMTVSSVDNRHVIEPNTKYCVIFIVTNVYQGDEQVIAYFEKHKTTATYEEDKEKKSSSGNNVHLWGLLPLLLIVPIGYLLYRCIKKRRDLRKKQATENFYETLPFDESPTNNYANNRHYDQLVHK